MSVLDADKAQQDVRAVQSSRFFKLDRLERYTTGEQYAHLVPFFDASDTPLLERAPYEAYPIAGLAIESHVSMVLGEGRFPTITTCGDEDDSDDSDADEPDSERAPSTTPDAALAETAPIEFGLSEDDSKRLDRLIRKVCKQSRFSTVCAAMLEAAMGCGSTVAIAGTHRGKLKVNVEPSKNCTATRDAAGDIVRLEIQRAYLEEYRDSARNNQLAVKAMVYRRVIDTTTDTVYKPMEAKDTVNLRPQDWKVQDQPVEHGYGFCPVAWYAFDADLDGNDCPDGHAIHERMLDEIAALDRLLSQWGRAVLYNGDPIITEIGVDPDHQPAPMIDVVSDVRYMSQEVAAGEAQFQRDWGARNRNVKQGRKRAPGMAYNYPLGAKVDYLALPPGAFEALEKKTANLEAKICEALHWCPIDPKTMQMSSALSGRAIEWLHKKQTDYDVTVRTDFGDNGLLPLLDLLLRIAYTIGRDPAKGRGLYLQGLQEALPVLERFSRQQSIAGSTTGETRTVWMTPEIDLQWPPFFPPTEADAKATGENVRADLQAGIIRQRTAVEKVAPYYGIKNVDAYMAGLEEDAADKMGSLHAAQDALAAAGADEGDDDAAAPGEPGTADAMPAKPPVQRHLAVSRLRAGRRKRSRATAQA